MPELPEVETVVRLIRPALVGRTIEAAAVRWARTIGSGTPKAFARDVTGACVRAVWRRGKFLVIDLERDGSAAGALVGHLRMTGRMHIEPRDADPGPFARVSLDLDDGRTFHFLDVRKFGRLVYARDPSLLLAKLGPEPLGEELTAEWLHAGCTARRRMLKPLLLDQSFLAGLGNIYVDEALHTAGLHPLRASDSLRRPQTRALHASIRATLAAAIEREGSSFDAFYRTPEGRPGSYQHQFRVYGRDGKPCRACGTKIVRMIVAQRGTHVCPKCQRAPRRPAAARAG